MNDWYYYKILNIITNYSLYRSLYFKKSVINSIIFKFINEYRKVDPINLSLKNVKIYIFYGLGDLKCRPLVHYPREYAQKKQHYFTFYLQDAGYKGYTYYCPVIMIDYGIDVYVKNYSPSSSVRKPSDLKYTGYRLSSGTIGISIISGSSFF